MGFHLQKRPEAGETSGVWSDQVREIASQNIMKVRGIGTDIAIVSGMVFLAQIILSSHMGTIVAAAGQSVVI